MKIKKQSGITIAEVVISLSLMVLFMANALFAIHWIKRWMTISVYSTGAERVLQSHVERLKAIPLTSFTNATYTNYNYSGFRMTSLGTEEAQSGLTNQAVRTFYTRNTNSYWQTNVSAVCAYETDIVVTNIGTCRQANISTYWVFQGRSYTNQTVMIRADN